MSYKFYGNHPGKNGWMFSNFSDHPVKAYGMVWPTSEHLFQAMKFITTDKDYFMKILLAPSPMAAKKMGQSRNHPLRKDWEEVKDDVMYFCVFMKALQHKDVKNELVYGTGNKEIIENSPTDYYWGCGANGRGQNKLGKVLMVVRETMRMHDP